MVRGLLLFLRILAFARASYQCMRIYGQLHCAHDPSKIRNVQLFDADGFLGIQAFNQDDFMGSTMTNADGSFLVYGCAEDQNFLFIVDQPDPYITMHHQCNGRDETLRRPLSPLFIGDGVEKYFLDLNLTSTAPLWWRRKMTTLPTTTNTITTTTSTTPSPRTLPAARGILRGSTKLPTTQTEPPTSPRTTTTEEPKLPQQLISYLTGDDATLSCGVSEFSEGSRLEWRKDGRILEVNETIAMTNITEADAGVYTCSQVANNRTVLLSDTKITVEPRKDATVSFSNIKHRTNQNVTIHCYIFDANVKLIEWKKDGQKIPPLSSTTDGTHLYLTSITLDAAGNYTCRYENRLAETMLTVDDPFPEFYWIFVILTSLSCCLFIIVMLTAKCRHHRKRADKLTFELYAMQNALLNKGLSWEQLRKEMLPMDQQVEKLAYKASQFEIPPRNLRIEGTLGSGQFGCVKRGWLKTPVSGGGDKEVLVAVKMALNVEDTKQQKMLADELKIMGAIPAHKNILRLVGAVTQNMRSGRLYIVTEFCERGSLLDYLRSVEEAARSPLQSPRYRSPTTVFQSMLNPGPDKAPMPLPKLLAGAEVVEPVEAESLLTANDLQIINELLNFSIQIAEGMAFLSAVPCVHRDLAARNVLLTHDKVCCIADFGLAKRMMNDYYRKDPNSPEGMPLLWMSPEAFETLRYTQASDVWSFGILLFEMFTLGAKPYRSGINPTLMEKIKGGLRCPQPEYASREVYSFMKDCWALSPARRPTFKQCVMILEELASQQLDLDDPTAVAEIIEVQNQIYFQNAKILDGYEPVTRRLGQSVEGLV
ncbi:unnamed protein product, partial [Mesorhabditis spiculigera]